MLGKFFDIPAHHGMLLFGIFACRKESIWKDLIENAAVKPSRGILPFFINQKLKIALAFIRRVIGFREIVFFAFHIKRSLFGRHTVFIIEESGFFIPAKLCHMQRNGIISLFPFHGKAFPLSRFIGKDLHGCAKRGRGNSDFEFNRIRTRKSAQLRDRMPFQKFFFKPFGNGAES